MISKIPACWCAVGDRHSGLPRLAINMKILDVQQSGTVGTMVSYKTRFGQVRRQYVKPRDPRTPAQVVRRRAMGRARFLWRKLNDEQRAEWHATAGDSRTSRRVNQSGRLRGYLLFVRINCNLAIVDLPMRLDAPGIATFGPNAVRALSITNIKGDVSLKLSVSGKPAQYIVVLGTKPRSAGVSYVDHFTILGVLPVPVGGLSDITDMYVSKYGMPAAGSRVFIQTFQLIDGWDDLPKQVSAIVPAP